MVASREVVNRMTHFILKSTRAESKQPPLLPFRWWSSLVLEQLILNLNKSLLV